MRKTQPNASDDKILDKKAIRDLATRILEINKELEETSQPVEQMELEAEKAKIVKRLKGARESMNDDSKRSRKAVSKAIKEAIERIEKFCPEFKNYLAKTIKTGKVCLYHPLTEMPITWTF